MLPNENKQMAFLHNMSWRPSAYVVTPKTLPVFSESAQQLKTDLREKFANWKTSFKKDKPQAIELEIPRDIL
jgi:hypothetical protein